MLIIFNPQAGRRRTAHFKAVLAILSAKGVAFEVVETTHPGHAKDIAHEATQKGMRVVVAAGGDGTIAEVANGLLGSDTALGIIPLGTANVLAQEHGIPNTPDGIADILVQQRCQPIWPGISHLAGQEHVFMQMLGLGFDGAVVKAVRPKLKRLIGKGAYVWQSLKHAVSYKYAPIDVYIDNIGYKAASVVVSKGRLYGGPYIIAPKAKPSEAGFQVVLFEKPGALHALLAAAALPLGLLPSCPGVRVVAGNSITFSTTEPGLCAQADGDSLQSMPQKITNSKTPISILVR